MVPKDLCRCSAIVNLGNVDNNGLNAKTKGR